MVDKSISIRQQRLQRRRAANNAQRIAASSSSQKQQDLSPTLTPGKAGLLQIQFDGNVEVSYPGVNHVKTHQHRLPSSPDNRGKERHASIPSSLPNSPKSRAVSTSIAEARYFNRRSSSPQSRNDNDSWFQYTNGTNMRQTTASTVSNKVNLIHNPLKKQQQQQPQPHPPNSSSEIINSDSAWASFSDSPFDNPFSIGNKNRGEGKRGTVEWPIDDEEQDTWNSTGKMNEKIRSDQVHNSVKAAASQKKGTPSATKTSTTAYQSKTHPQKETMEVEDDEIEFWGIESNSTGHMNDDKESDIAAIFNYRKNSRGGGNDGKKKTANENSSSPGYGIKLKNNASTGVIQIEQQESSSSMLMTSNTSNLNGSSIQNKQQRFSSSSPTPITPSLSKLTTSSTLHTPTSAMTGPYDQSPAKPINLEANRFKSMPRANLNSRKSTKSPILQSTSSSSPVLPLPSPSGSSYSDANKNTELTGNSSAAFKMFGSRSALQQNESSKTVAAPFLSSLLSSPPNEERKKSVITESSSIACERFYSSLPQRQNKHKSVMSSTSHSPIDTTRPSSLNMNCSTAFPSPSPKFTSRSNLSNSTKNEAESKPPAPRVGSTFRKQTLPPKPYIKPSLPSKSNSSIVIKHGGTPVWVHTSIFKEGKNIETDVSWNWVRAYLSAASDNTMEVNVDDSTSSEYNGKAYTISKCYNDGKRILMGNAWWASPESSVNDGRGMPPEDLVELTHLHEPAIVHALEARYEQDIIYTNTGSILLAVNPFKKIDNLYTREMMELYWNHENNGNSETRPPPHAFAVAERAFSSMMHSLDECDVDDQSRPPCNQTILVSGESGAGKTVNTKIVMRYLTLISQRHMRKAMSPTRTDMECMSVESQVLQSNPILESFGNARTIRNDNSSRFGKFIEMSFQAQHDDPSCSRGTLLGASIDFYLLEKVRLVSVNPGERNYHVFYEITCPRGMSLKEKKRYKLTSSFGRGDTPMAAEDFFMTSISGTFDRRDGVLDADTYQELRMALDSVGFAAGERESIFRVTAALLHASNLRFENRGSDDCFVFDGDGTLNAVANLLGVSIDSLQTALTSSVIEARGEILIKRLSTAQATKALEALTKATYGALFEYIVKRINQSIEVHWNADELELNKVATIGVLDIFGFESFHTNSFEQLCINYCNEALQQQFAKFVFKAEQAEYEEEGIGWSNIDFPDNQETLDLIEAKRVGIFSVLDEQCRLPKRTDLTFAKALHDSCEKNEFYVASQMQQSKGSFSIVHYAGEVEYDSSGFIVKNKHDLPKGTFDLLSSSTVELISELACILESSNDVSASSNVDNPRAPIRRSSSTLARATVSSQFSSQLRVLRSRIEMTEPHYIRCLKPNDRLVANSFDHFLISHQLNCAGVLPAMKMARAGFAMRYLHSSFEQRFSPIVNKLVASASYKSLKQAERSKKLVGLLASTLDAEMKKKLGTDVPHDVVSWGVQIGKTKVFLRATAFESLEELRYTALNKAAIIIQANARSFLERNRLLLRLGSILTLQCAARKMIATVFVRKLRFHRKAIYIQTQWRSYSAWFSYQNILFITVWCQRFWRGRVVRREFSSITQQMQQVKYDLEKAIAQQSKTNSADRDEKIQLLSQECAKKDLELEMLRKEVDALRERSVTQPPTTVTFSQTSPSPSRSSALGVPFLPLNASHIFRDTSNMPSSNLLDSEMEGLSSLESFRISHQDSRDDTFEKGQYNSLNISMESSFVDDFTALPFHSAVKSNDFKQLLNEIEKASSDIETNINSVDSKGRTPLHVAVQNSNIALAKVLLSNNAIVNAQDFAGNTALHYADSPNMCLLLLEQGSSPNIPNGKGLCSLHLAVQRRDFASVKLLLSRGADVNNADDECWYTPLHLIAHPESVTVGKKEMSLRGPIAELLCEAKSPSVPDLNYQDRDGNTPLHHAASLAEEDAGILISVFIEHGSCPKIANNRGQTPVHLFCHNNAARNFIFYHEALHLMLVKGASPNHQSLSGCTALHLALYHQDVEAAAMLVRYGAQLNIPWKKPLKWNAFWTGVGPDDVVLPLDMLEDVVMLHRVLTEVSTPQISAPRRQKCMHCKLNFGVFARPKHCANCGRSVCGRCAKGSLRTSRIPSLLNSEDESPNTVCILCEHIILSRANNASGEGSDIARSDVSTISF